MTSFIHFIKKKNTGSPKLKYVAWQDKIIVKNDTDGKLVVFITGCGRPVNISGYVWASCSGRLRRLFSALNDNPENWLKLPLAT